jgi:hypothetical protein
MAQTKNYKPFPLHLALTEDEVRGIYDKEQYLFSHHRQSMDEVVGTDAAVNATGNIERCNREHEEGEALRYLFSEATTPSTRSGKITELQLAGSPKNFIGLCEHFSAVAQHGSGLVIPFAKVLNGLAVHCNQAVTQAGAAALMPAALIDPNKVQIFDIDKGFFEFLPPEQDNALDQTMQNLRRHVYRAGASDWTLGRHRITRDVVTRAIDGPAEYDWRLSGMIDRSIRAKFINQANRTNPDAFGVKNRSKIAMERNSLRRQVQALQTELHALASI